MMETEDFVVGDLKRAVEGAEGGSGSTSQRTTVMTAGVTTLGKYCSL